MTISRFAKLGLACLFASACTVVVQPAANRPRTAPSDEQPQTAPSTTERDTVVVATDTEPARRPTPRVPTTGPSNPVPDPVYNEPQPPARRPSPRSNNPRSNRLNLRVPPGHLPPPGECRVWVDGLPPGQQARARSCSGILATASPGSWILYRPAQYHRQVRVRYLHDTRRMVIAVRAFDTETGAYLRDYALEEDDNNMGPVARGTGRPTIRPGDDRTGNRGNGTRERPTVADNQGNGGRGNSDNAPGQIRTANDTSAAPGSNGNSAGRGNGNREGTTVAGNQGNSGRGNSDNAPGRTKTANDTVATPGNNGGTVGRGNGPRERSTAANDRGRSGNQPVGDRVSATGGDSSNRGSDKPVTVTDSTVPGRPGDADNAVAEERVDDPSRRGQPVGNISGAVRVADSAASSTATGESAAGNAQRSRNPSVAGAITGSDGEKVQDRREGEPGTPAPGVGAAAGAVADVEEHASLGIHRRFFPRPGSCRVWVPDLPNRRQATAESCDGITEGAPAGAWILRRSADEPNAIRVDYLDEQNAGVIVRTRVFNVATGQVQKTARRH